MAQRRRTEPESAKAQAREAPARRAKGHAPVEASSYTGHYYILDLTTRVQLMALYSQYGAGMPPVPKLGLLLHAKDGEVSPAVFESKKLAEAAIARTIKYLDKALPQYAPHDPGVFQILTSDEVAWMQMTPAQRRKISNTQSASINA